jgi:hypothetical protein
MAKRFPNVAAPGSLLKDPEAAAGRRSSKTRRREKVDHFTALRLEYLATVRKCPCIDCGTDPAGEAAHVRRSSAAHGKTAGMAIKPDDIWALPLCHPCHMRQHEVGEPVYWAQLQLDPLKICSRLVFSYPDLDAMRAYILLTRAAPRRAT